MVIPFYFLQILIITTTFNGCKCKLMTAEYIFLKSLFNSLICVDITHRVLYVNIQISITVFSPEYKTTPKLL